MSVRIVSELATEQEAAQELRVPMRVVAEMRRRGDIEYVKAGRQIRIPWSEITRLKTHRRTVPLRGPHRDTDRSAA